MSVCPRFTIERELGHGGEGRVVAVRDAARAGAIVALKETHGPLGRALGREFELLATLRHRHLAEVYEYFARSPLGGERAAYTQMLVPGSDLYRTLRADPALAHTLVGQLLRALAQLHAAGLAHLDLKPDNVIVEPGATPRARLVDFGVAARIGSRPDIVRGSRSYVAPEILAGEVVTASADLFALGIALAEIALGSPTAARAMASEPLPARFAGLRAAGMSEPIAHFTAELVCLDPKERPASAHAAAHRWSALRNTSLALVTRASASGLARSGGLVARSTEKARILSAVAGRQVLTVAGPAASGRTAVMESALREAQLRGHAVEAWPLLAATSSIDGFLAALGRLVPAAEQLTLTPEREDVSSPERWAASLDAAADAAFAAFAALAPEPGQPPAALFVRHGRDAPAPVRAFLRAAIRSERVLPLGFVLAVDDEHAADIVLGPVGADAVRSFVASRFGDRVAADDALISALASASAGLTGHLEALLELLVARRDLALGEEGWRLLGDPRALELSADVGEAIALRVALLEPSERTLLAALASLGSAGQGASVEVIEAALDEAPGSALDDLVAFGLVRRDADGAVALGHPVLASVLPPLTLAHDARTRVMACPSLDELVRARLEGGAIGAARALVEARRALAASRPESAQAACALALELARSDDPIAHSHALEALWLSAEIADRLGPRESQLATLSALIDQLGERDPRRLAAEGRRFWTLTRMGDPTVEALGEDLLVRARAAGQPLLSAEVAVHLAIVASQRGDQDRAEDLLLGARERLAPGPETLAIRARIYNNLGNVYSYRSAFHDAQEAYREARRLKREEGDPIGERIALGNIALMSLALGEPGRALEDLARSFALARGAGHRRGEAWSLLTLAEVGLEGASPRYARRRAEAAATLAEALGDLLVEGDARTTLAEALLDLDEPLAAREQAERGAALATQAQNEWTTARARALRQIAEARMASGDARRSLERSLAASAADTSADTVTRQIAARHAAEAALAGGDLAQALALVEQLGPDETPRGGVRWAALLNTRLRVLRAVGSPNATRLAGRAQDQLMRWLHAWPETPGADGVDDSALVEGPCRRTVRAHPAVVALLSAASEGTRDTGDAGDEVERSSPPLAPSCHEETALLDAKDALASLAVPALDRLVTTTLVEIVLALEAERAFLLRLTEAGTEHPSLLLLDARDADGEPIAEAHRRLPEAATEAVLRRLAWRAPGPDGRGAIASVPWSVSIAGRDVSGAVVLQNRFIAEAFGDADRSAEAVARLVLPLRLRLLEAAIEDAQGRARAALQEVHAVEARTTEEIRSLRRELESTREQLGPERDYPEIVFASAAMKKMLRQVDRVVATDLPVHVHGESGTGKELVARAIHQLGTRASGPFVPQNCTAIPPTLFESELFGHERGAFTGAMRSHEGLFRRAHRGTLFLDEIGDLTLELQAKLLRVLETGEVRPVGASRSISVDVRIVSATHRDLSELIKKGTFREDLFYRLNVIRIDVPALRDRPEDVPALVQHFLRRRVARGDSELVVDDAAMRALVRFAWPGNVRQLENEIARASLLAEGGVVRLTDLSPEVASPRTREAARPDSTGAGVPSLDALGLTQGPLKDRVDRLETLALEAALRDAAGNKSEVARVLGLSRAGLNLKLKRLGLWDSTQGD